MAKTYEVVQGIDHPKGRQEAGEVYSGPTKSIGWLLECGAILELSDDATPAEPANAGSSSSSSEE